MIEINCTNCGKPFLVKPYIVTLPTKHGNFCSASCRSKYVSSRSWASQKRRIETKCAYCDKSIFLWESKIRETNYCSRSCLMKDKLKERWAGGAEFTTVQCAYCNSEKIVPAWDVEQKRKRGQDQFFCNRDCFGKWKSANWCKENNPSWKGGWTKHGTGWKEIREVVRREQNYKCLDCGISEDDLRKELDVHHIVPARLFSRKSDASIRSNLIALCHKCHMIRENS